MSENERGGNDVAVVALVNNRFFFKDANTGEPSFSREDSSEEVVAICEFVGPVAKVRRGYGLTLNLTRYEFARLDVSIEVPCYLEDADAADEWARQWVENRVMKEVASVRGEKAAKKKPRY